MKKMLCGVEYLMTDLQGASVILRMAVGRFNYEIALAFRTVLFFFVFVTFITGNIICVLRLLIVLQVIYVIEY